METESENPQDEQGAEASGTMSRTTEQGDELTEKYSLALRQHRAHRAYLPPRQPSQDPPSG